MCCVWYVWYVWVCVGMCGYVWVCVCMCVCARAVCVRGNGVPPLAKPVALAVTRTSLR